MTPHASLTRGVAVGVYPGCASPDTPSRRPSSCRTSCSIPSKTGSIVRGQRRPAPHSSSSARPCWRQRHHPTARSPSTAGACSRSSPRRTCPTTTQSSTRSATSSPCPARAKTHRIPWGRHRKIHRRVGSLRPGPHFRRRRARPDRRHPKSARTCGCPSPRHRTGARGRTTVLANVGVPRSRSDAARTAGFHGALVSARCSAAYIYTAAGMEASPARIWPGTARPRLRPGERAWRLSASGDAHHDHDVDLERLRTEVSVRSFWANAQRYAMGG